MEQCTVQYINAISIQVDPSGSGRHVGRHVRGTEYEILSGFWLGVEVAAISIRGSVMEIILVLGRR
jgi:hypothetical protein